MYSVSNSTKVRLKEEVRQLASVGLSVSIPLRYD